MKKTAQKLAGVAVAVPLLLGGIAIPAHAEMTMQGAVTQLPGPGVPTVSTAQKAIIARAVAAIRAKNPSLGASSGPIQYGLYAGSAIAKYKGGIIVWHRYGAAAVKGAVLGAYNRAYGIGGPGYPKSGEIRVRGGVVQQFALADIYWSPTTGAHIVGFEDTWLRNGGVNGRLGFPTSDVTRDLSVPGGYKTFQKFQGGTIYSGDKGINRVVFNKK